MRGLEDFLTVACASGYAGLSGGRPVTECVAHLASELGPHRLSVLARTDRPIGLLSFESPARLAISFAFAWPEAELTKLVGAQAERGLASLDAMRRNVEEALGHALKGLAFPPGLEGAFAGMHYDFERGQLEAPCRYREGLEAGRIGSVAIDFARETPGLPEPPLTDRLVRLLEAAHDVAVLLRYRHLIEEAEEGLIWPSMPLLRRPRGRPSLDRERLAATVALALQIKRRQPRLSNNKLHERVAELLTKKGDPVGASVVRYRLEQAFQKAGLARTAPGQAYRVEELEALLQILEAG